MFLKNDDDDDDSDDDDDGDDDDADDGLDVNVFACTEQHAYTVAMPYEISVGAGRTGGRQLCCAFCCSCAQHHHQQQQHDTFVCERSHVNAFGKRDGRAPSPSRRVVREHFIDGTISSSSG